MRTFFILLVFIVSTSAHAESPSHGAVNKNAVGNIQVWNENNKQWTDVDTFWIDFAKVNEAKSWPTSATYPNYDDVNEFDTFLVKTKQGPCLMQFFHSRWRRANDVQRWDDTFNTYGGCPYVFD